MVGGGSPNALRNVQQKLISSGKIEYFNSPDHDSTLVNVASGIIVYRPLSDTLFIRDSILVSFTSCSLINERICI